MGLVTLALAAVLAAAPPQAASLLSSAARPTCSRVDLRAQSATCNANGCALQGHAVLRCETLTLVADVIHVAVDAQQQFAGAQALGHVTLHEGLRVVQAEAITLAGDRLQGAICGATFTVRRPDPVAMSDADGIPQGPRALTLTGDLRRSPSGELTATGATLTLCDCGSGQTPSWRLDAPWVTLTPSGRAVIGWPQLRLNVGGWALVPVTPPLLPLWLPLRPRALGLLPPQVSFLGPPFPTVDIPLFVPLGDSWDLTLTPGARGDWGWAPRLGVRVRGRPSGTQSLQLTAGFTWDVHRRMAAQRMAFEARHAPHRLRLPESQALMAQRRALTLRAAVSLEHQALIWRRPTRLWADDGDDPEGLAQAALTWTSQWVWISDDEVNRDLGVALSERVAAYLPSRSQLLWRRPTEVALLRTDIMLNLNSWAARGDGASGPVLANFSGPELYTLHKLPEAAIRWPGWALGRHGPWRLDGHVAMARFSPWVPEAQAPGLSRLHGGLGLAAARPLGPVRARFRLGLDAVGTHRTPAGEAPAFAADLVGVADGRLSLPLVRQGAFGAHLLRPWLRVRGLWRRGEGQRLAGPGPGLGPTNREPQVAGPDVDPYLDRRALQQVALGISQTYAAAPGGGPSAAWGLAQPYDVWHGQWLAARTVWRLSHPGGVTVSGHATWRWRSAPGPRLRELQSSLGLQRPSWGLSGTYLRAAPDADRLTRSVYALAALPPGFGPWVGGGDRPAGGPWAHLLQVAMQARRAPGPPGGLAASYALSFALPQPGDWQAFGDLLGAATAQSLTVSYSSPCRCWGMTGVMSASPQNLRQSWRMHVALQVGDVRL